MSDDQTLERPRTGTDPASARIRGGRVRLSWLSWEAVFLVALVSIVAVALSSSHEAEDRAEPHESTLAGHDFLLETVALAAEQDVLITTGSDDTVRFWELDPAKPMDWGVEVQSLPHGSRPYALSPSADGRYLAVGGGGSLAIWERKGEGWVLLTTREGTDYRYLAFAPDSRTLAIGGEGGDVRVLDVPSMKELRVLKGLDDGVHSIVFSPDGAILAAASFRGELVMWDWRTGVVKPALEAIGRVQCLAFTPDGRSLATAHWVEGGGVALHDLATGRLKARFGSREGFNSLTFSPDGSLLAAAATDHSIRLWDARTGEVKGVLDKDIGWVKTILFTTEGTRLAYGGRDGTVHFWNIPAGAVDAQLSLRPRGERHQSRES
ncbi:WD40 repeat domain-containing protein [Paludisphaera rhizosphaerae]|uniref:WD40 repeat domain-containing protein n=1 Tax=Paludisphaera rhizosphaerae TaxID=2711216 RepID=UPI0013EBE104|nr:WD40 repeat domain-containing protein [Paludisphaera rhizosphaerae]